MDDDFNTPQAVGYLFELTDLAFGFISKDLEDVFKYSESKLEIFFKIFGLKVKSRKEWQPEIKKMIEEREQARKNKDFKKADAIREELKTKFKLIVSDTGSSVTFTEIE